MQDLNISSRNFWKDFKEKESEASLRENFDKLFYNPMEGTVRPQSRLLWRVIKEVV